jgi:hypothetical protein
MADAFPALRPHLLDVDAERSADLALDVPELGGCPSELTATYLPDAPVPNIPDALRFAA